MEKIFIGLLNMSINAGWLILAVLVLRLILKKAAHRILCALWIPVGLRLVCPARIKSIFSLIPSAEPIPPEILHAPTPAINSGIPALNRTVNPMLTGSFAPSVGDSVNPLQIVTFIAAIVWIVGVCVMLLYAGIGYFRIRRKISEKTEVERDIYVCARADTPFIFGTMFPKIILPSDVSDTDRVYVLAHERAHLKRGDHIWKLLGYALLTVYWFHPLIWLAYTLFCRDIEAACDERVIATLGDSCKKPYSEALVNCSASGKLIPACPPAFGEISVKHRIRTVLGYRKPALWLSITAAAVCIIVGICFMTDPVGSVSDIPGLITDDSKWSYTMEEATEMGWLVLDGLSPVAGTKEWNQFVEDTRQGHDRTIYIYQAYSEPDNSTYIKELVFDGTKYRLTFHDRYGDTGEEFLSQKEYKYLIHSTGPVFDRGESDCYMLSDDPDMTEEKFLKAVASSQIDVGTEAMSHNTIIYIDKGEVR